MDTCKCGITTIPSTHVTISQFVSKMCSQQACSTVCEQVVTQLLFHQAAMCLLSSTLLQDAEYQLVADLSNNWGQAVRTHPDIDLISTDLLQLAYLHSINQV